MKSKEEVLNNALIVLNKPDKPWEVTITNDSIVAKWKWMDATFFAPSEITNEVKEYSYIVTLTDKGKWIEKDITSEKEKTAARRLKTAFMVSQLPTRASAGKNQRI